MAHQNISSVQKNEETKIEKDTSLLLPVGPQEGKEISTIQRKAIDQLLRQGKASVSSPDESEYFLRVWDFGGQAEFYTTHHMFLDADAVNLIVMDISKDLRTPLHESSADLNLPGIPKTPLEFLHYWLNTIHDDASQRNLQPSVALVLTHKDEISGVYIDKYMQDYIEDLLHSFNERSYSSYISRENIFVVDNRHGEEWEFQKVRSQVLNMITKQKSWGTEKPVKWLRHEADIVEKAEAEDVGHFRRKVIENLAKTYNLKEEEFKSFLQFHHGLGNFVYFNDPALKDVVITNPQWLVDKFKSLITPHQFL